MYVVIVKVDSTSEVDFALIQDPIFTTTYVETQHKVNSGSVGYIHQHFIFSYLATDRVNFMTLPTRRKLPSLHQAFQP